MKCGVKECTNYHYNCHPSVSFHRLPRDEALAKKWIDFCGQPVHPGVRICSAHFVSEDFLDVVKRDMGLVKSLLKKGAYPTVRQSLTSLQNIEGKKKITYTEYKSRLQSLSNTNQNFIKERLSNKDALASIYQQNMKYLESVERAQWQNEESEGYASKSLETIQQTSMEKETLINEALFDHEEFSDHDNNSLDTAKDNADSTFCSSMDITPEQDSLSTFSESMHINNQRNYSVAACCVSKRTQTDEVAEDRINCGFVNVSKSGTDKYFNLRCFYCDTEYPISFWTEFSDHIQNSHGHLENFFDNNDDLETIVSEHNVVDDGESTDTATEEEMPPIPYINVDDIVENDSVNCINLSGNMDTYPKTSTKKKKKEEKPKIELDKTLCKSPDTLDAFEPYVFGNKYVPTIDHSYSITTVAKKSTYDKKLNGAAAPIDEIIFSKTPRYIVFDFLDHLKGYPSLWRDRKLDCGQFDEDLSNLIELMTLKWELNLSMNSVYRNLESIKTWFKGVRDAKERSEQSHIQHLFGEYYKKCAEFLIFENVSKQYLLRCDLCNRGNANVAKLEAHKFCKHGIGQLPYGCNKCDKRFMYVEKLTKHLRKHKKMVAKNKKRIDKLIRMASKKVKKKEIIIIKKTQQQPKTASKPAPVPAPQPPPSPKPPLFECFECNEQFLFEAEYQLHLDIHPKGNCPYECNECGARFKLAHTRNLHCSRVHTSNLYQCKICLAKIKTAWSFKIHMAIHNKSYEYVCEWCGERFVCRAFLKDHCKYTHFGAGKCKICNRTYKYKSAMYSHLKNAHKPTFGTIEELSLPRNKRKRGTIKGKPRPVFKLRKYEYDIDPRTKKRRLKCPKCDKTFRCYKSLLEHTLKSHNFDCRTIQRGEGEGPERFQSRPRQKKKNKLLKYELEANTEVEEAIYDTEYIDTKIEIVHYKSGDDDSVDNTATEMNETEYDESTIEFLFEPFVDDNTIRNEFALLSPNDLVDIDVEAAKKLETKNEEEFECDSYIVHSHKYNVDGRGKVM